MNDQKALGALIAARRRELGLMQKEAAERSGCCAQTLSKIESGEPGCTYTFLQVLKALGLDLKLEPQDACTLYVCNGLKADCTKTGCYYTGAGECRATTDERYAIRRNDEPVLDPSKKQ